MAGVKLTWRGGEVQQRIEQAAIDGVNTTLLEAVEYAQQPGVTPRDTSALANSITLEEAGRDGGGITGRFGSWTIDYALYVEVGTYKMAGRFYLRRSADATFRNLSKNIGANLR